MSKIAAAAAPSRRAISTRLGLALSGGGFRAAFFHLGVLAHLAEIGELRRVEVISTVSGGSIIGALYYLHVKNLLQSLPAREIQDAHYVQIVERVQHDFLAGVQKHLRALTFASLWKNVKMVRPDYSRSNRIGELYDEVFYRPAWNNPIWKNDQQQPRSDPIRMRDLPIVPKDGAAGRDEVPLPILLINATSLNTGHSWCFDSEALGEPPRASDQWLAIDKNTRLLRARYVEIARHQTDFGLGLAVAASACVPGLFHPLPVSGLFRDVRANGEERDVRVQLVDGGVHDNQGVAGLFDTGCTRLIVSDASGQMLDVDEPSTRTAAVGLRSIDIYGDRVREEQLISVEADGRATLMHLRKGLPAAALRPLGQDRKPLGPKLEEGSRDYGVNPAVQFVLSRIRTDLDAFTEVEAWSLALYGYWMAKTDIPGIAQAHGTWAFASLGPRLADGRKDYLHHLEVGRRRFFKPLHLMGLGWAIVPGGVLGLGLVAYRTGNLKVLAVVALGALYALPTWKIRWIGKLANLIYDCLVPPLLAPLFWAAALVMLAFNKGFLKRGRLQAVLGGEPK